MSASNKNNALDLFLPSSFLFCALQTYCVLRDSFLPLPNRRLHSYILENAALCWTHMHHANQIVAPNSFLGAIIIATLAITSICHVRLAACTFAIAVSIELFSWQLSRFCVPDLGKASHWLILADHCYRSSWHWFVFNSWLASSIWLPPGWVPKS